MLYITMLQLLPTTNPLQSDDKKKDVCAHSQKRPGSCIIERHHALRKSISVLYLVTDFSPSDRRKLEANDTFIFFKVDFKRTTEMKLDMIEQLKITRI